jgi:archaellum component FlaF (FlaF/FlaG flagellin family)
MRTPRTLHSGPAFTLVELPVVLVTGRVQADYLVPKQSYSITIFKPSAITLIAVPGDDGGGAGSP